MILNRNKFKIMLLFLSAIVVLMLYGCRKATPINDFVYEYDDGEVVITEYKGSDISVIIPSEIDNRPVTTIGAGAFEKYDLEYIEFPETITTIEEKAFYDCDMLKKISLPDSLSFIGYKAFDDCDRIKSVIIPDNVSFDWRGLYTAHDGIKYIICSPVSNDTVIYVADDSKAHRELVLNDEILEKYFSSLRQSSKINYIVK